MTVASVFRGGWYGPLIGTMQSYAVGSLRGVLAGSNI